MNWYLFQLDTDLKYTVDQTIKETVANAGNDLENTGSLVEIIIRQLRPVIFKAVQNALASAGATSIGKYQATNIILCYLLWGFSRPFKQQHGY